MQDHCFITPACVANGRPDFMFWQTWVWCAVFLLSSCIVVWYSLDCERVCWLVFLFEVTNCVLMFGVASSQKTSHQFCDCISCPVGQCLKYFCNLSHSVTCLSEHFCDLCEWLWHFIDLFQWLKHLCNLFEWLWHLIDFSQILVHFCDLSPWLKHFSGLSQWLKQFSAH